MLDEKHKVAPLLSSPLSALLLWKGIVERK